MDWQCVSENQVATVSCQRYELIHFSVSIFMMRWYNPPAYSLDNITWLLKSMTMFFCILQVQRFSPTLSALEPCKGMLIIRANHCTETERMTRWRPWIEKMHYDPHNSHQFKWQRNQNNKKFKMSIKNKCINENQTEKRPERDEFIIWKPSIESIKNLLLKSYPHYET